MNANIYVYQDTPPIPPAQIAGPVTATQTGAPPHITLTFNVPGHPAPAGLVNNQTYTVCSGPYNAASNPGYGLTWNAAANQFS